MKLVAILAVFSGISPVFAVGYDFGWRPPVIHNLATGDHVPGKPEWTAWFANNNKDLVPNVQSDVTKCTGPSKDVWAQTFDDGPWDGTPIVLDHLDAVNVKTTFWVIGSNIAKRPELLQRAFASGHGIGCHTWSHPTMSKLTDDEVIAELVYCVRAIYAVLGVYPKYWRPPYGATSSQVRKLSATMGLISVRWSQDSGDWNFTGKPEIMSVVTNNFKNWLKAGASMDISLEHDLQVDEARAGVAAMDILIQNGRKIIPFHECIGDAYPYDNPILARFFETSGLFQDHWGGGDVVSKLPATTWTTTKTTTTTTTTITTTTSTASTATIAQTTATAIKLAEVVRVSSTKSGASGVSIGAALTVSALLTMM
ncbi:hypothetical protein BC830DRAFT_1155361 [Chytriomyces sp. MP71]|nr:hypothetical protein BC830DRAFT_1155361 [Chytriomyces sp. MP71]